MFTLSPLSKYTTYKIQLSLVNAVSRFYNSLEVSRVRNTDQSVVITLHWVDIPADTEVEVWEQLVKDSVTQEIMDNIPIESWRLFVDLSVQEEQGYTIHVRVRCLFVCVFVCVLLLLLFSCYHTTTRKRACRNSSTC